MTRLRYLRQQAGLTQPRLAVRAHLDPRTVGDVERGQVARPHPATLVALARALGHPVAAAAQLLDQVDDAGQILEPEPHP